MILLHNAHMANATGDRQHHPFQGNTTEIRFLLRIYTILRIIHLKAVPVKPREHLFINCSLFTVTGTSFVPRYEPLAITAVLPAFLANHGFLSDSVD